jgi:hypothetical protein
MTNPLGVSDTGKLPSVPTPGRAGTEESSPEGRDESFQNAAVSGLIAKAEAEMFLLRGLKSPFSLLLAGGLLLTLGCDRRSEQPASDVESAGKAVAKAARDTAHQAADAAKDAAEKAKAATADLRASIKTELEKFDRSRPELERQARETKGKAGEASRRTLDELRTQTEDLRKSAEELKTQTADKLDAARAELDQKLEKLKRAYDAAAREMKK